MATVWIVSDIDDCRNEHIVAAYSSEELADQHVALLGGWIAEEEVRGELHPDAIDPQKQAERAAEAERFRAQAEAHRIHEQRDAELRRNTKPNPPYMRLCHCQTFSTSAYFINDHGYCGYCGSFTPKVFRAHMGEMALQEHIDKLAEHNRLKMREIVAAM